MTTNISIYVPNKQTAAKHKEEERKTSAERRAMVRAKRQIAGILIAYRHIVNLRVFLE